MSEPKFQRRLAENEVIFRQYNERITQGFEEIKKVALEDGQEHRLSDYDVPLDFFCECSDEYCRKRIALAPSEYTDIHELRNRFVVIKGHEKGLIEFIVKRTSRYFVVEKYSMPPAAADKLRATNIKKNQKG